MRFGVLPWLVACPLVLCVGCFGVQGVDVLDPDAGGNTGGASASSSTSSSGASTSASTGGAGGMGTGGATSSSASSSSSSSASASSSGAGGGGTGGAGGGSMAMCPDVPDTPTMIMVQTPAGGPSYCIDSTEVTNAQYMLWVNTNPMVTQPAECAFNTSFMPSGTLPASNSQPIANVDWCDAYAFCMAHQKKLCGRIGGGPPLSMTEIYDIGKSQWHNACTKSGTQAFPYGDTYGAMACNGADNGVGAPIAVGSQPSCEGGYPGIFDMSGNVWEWEDSCNGTTGTGDACRRRGGSYTSQHTSPNLDLDCATTSTSLTRGGATTNTGFRCCADL